MPKTLRISFRLHDQQFHGRCDGDEPEWPPSPLRMFQSLIAAAASRWNERIRLETAVPAFQWLEQQNSPTIVAPYGMKAQSSYGLYVPNNAADLVASAWNRGYSNASMAEHRTKKEVRPVRLEGNTVHYLYELPDKECPCLEMLTEASRHVTHLGWGIDMAAGSVAILNKADVLALTGHIWQPVPVGGTPLRVPIDGTLAALQSKHDDFLNRLSESGFRPVPPLSRYKMVGYYCPTVGETPPIRQVAAYEIHRTIAELDQLPTGSSKFRPFNTTHRFAHVAGMVRHAAAEVARSSGWTADKIDSFIHGHGDEKSGQATTDDRLMFLPLPSVNVLTQRVDTIQRVLVVGPTGASPDFVRLRQLLNGTELIPLDAKQPVAVLSYLRHDDRAVSCFTRESRSWSTVTPVMLPGYDDPDGLRRKLRNQRDAETQRHLIQRLDARVMSLLQKAFEHMGLPRTIVESAQIEYNAVGYCPGLEPANRYELPPLRFPRYHVRVQFAYPIRGPLAVGAGRYRGLGLFVSHEG